MKAQKELIEAVESYRKGNKGDFDQIYTLSHKYLYVCIKHIVKDEETAGDMLQETYLEISRSISQLKNSEDFLNWAAVIAKRKCFAYMNHSDRYVLAGSGDGEDGQEFFDSIADDEAFIPESIMQDREKRRLMREIIDGLSDMQRLCVIGYYYNEQKQEEIAEELGIPVNTVKSHLNRAKAKIREEVLVLEKEKDTKLYAIAPFMLLFFAEEVQACETVPMAKTLVELSGKLNEVSEAAGKAASKVGKLAELGLKTKLVIGIAALAGIACIAAAAVGLRQNAEEEAKEDEDTVQDSERTEDLVEENNVAEESKLPETGTEEGEETLTEENAEEPELTELAISGIYDDLRSGRDGVVIALRGEKWGLVTYDNQILVPFEYDYAGIGLNDDGQTFFGNDGDYRVFDREGNEIFQINKPIKAVSDGVVLWVQAEEDAFYNFGYVKLDGTVIFESSGEDVDGQAGAVGFSEGYAFSSNGNMGTEYRIAPNGSTEDIFEKRKRTVYPEVFAKVESTTTDYSADSWWGSASYPIGASCHGYYLDKGITFFEDSNGLLYVWDVEGTQEYLLRMESLADYAGFSWWDDELWWGIRGFYNNGNYCYNYGTIVSVYLMLGGESKDFLLDTAKLEKDETGGAGWTVVTDAAILFQGEHIEVDNNTYWLAAQNGQWGYVDHGGNVVAMFDSATRFSNGKAMVMKDGCAYFVDEDMNLSEWKIPAESIEGSHGDIYIVETAEGQKCFTTAKIKN